MEIVPVSDGHDLKQFIAFPYHLHRDDPLWAPPLRRDVRTLLSPEKNPFFQHAEAAYFLARRDGRVVGRIAAIKNDEHQRVHQDRVGFYGFFESVDDQAVASALFDTAAAWLRGRSPSLEHWCACAGLGDVTALRRWLWPDLAQSSVVLMNTRTASVAPAQPVGADCTRKPRPVARGINMVDPETPRRV